MKRVERHRSQSGTAPYGAYGAGRNLSGRDDLVSFELKGNQRSEMKHMERPRSESRRVPDRGDDIGTHLSRNSGAGVWGPKATSPISASDEDFGSSGSELERLASSFEFYACCLILFVVLPSVAAIVATLQTRSPIPVDPNPIQSAPAIIAVMLCVRCVSLLPAPCTHTTSSIGTVIE
jgi:hypothetical protein